MGMADGRPLRHLNVVARTLQSTSAPHFFPLGCPTMGEWPGLDPWDTWSRVDGTSRRGSLRCGASRLPTYRDDEPKLPLLQLLIVAALLWVGLAALTALAVYWYW
jgi:hypothetical protein